MCRVICRKYRISILAAGAFLSLGLLLFPKDAAAAAKTTKVPRYDKAVQRGVEYLKKTVTQQSDPSRSVLAAYALFKAGESIESPIVKRGLEIAEQSAGTAGFRPHLAYDHVYESGLYCMFLTDVDPVKYKSTIQVIADYVASVQHPDGAWSDTPRDADTSMCQYAMLALWAAHRAECRIPPETLDRAATWHIQHRWPDGGWGYRETPPGAQTKSKSSRNMTMAAVSSLGISRLLLYGPPEADPEVEPQKKFGILQKEEQLGGAGRGSMFADYRPRNDLAALKKAISWGVGYESENYRPINIHEFFPIYFYYSAERALSISGISTIAGKDWYTAYGDGLLTLQGASGSWTETFKKDEISGTSFAILYFMRSTQQILDKHYGPALQKGNRGNPLAVKSSSTEVKSLDRLLNSLDNVDLNNPELDSGPDFADEIVRSVQSISDRKQLIGQVDRLKALVKHPDPDVRQPVYWALGRTGDISLAPILLKGLRDPNVDVNVEAELALRFLARRPSGFNLSTNPLEGAEKADDAERLRIVNQWRDKAVREWSNWYRNVQPYEDTGSIDELELTVPDSKTQ